MGRIKLQDLPDDMVEYRMGADDQDGAAEARRVHRDALPVAGDLERSRKRAKREQARRAQVESRFYPGSRR